MHFQILGNRNLPLILAVLSSGSLWVQAASIQITGKVVDPVNQPIQGCKVSTEADSVFTSADGSFSLNSVTAIQNRQISSRFQIANNKLKYTLASQSKVEIEIHDLKGNQVFQKKWEKQDPGQYQLDLNNQLKGKSEGAVHLLTVIINGQKGSYKITPSQGKFRVTETTESQGNPLAKTAALKGDIKIHCPSSLPKYISPTGAVMDVGNVTIKKANILLLYADDMNSWTGQTNGWAKTPNIDKLASTGVYFNNAHVIAQECGSSRAATLTGKRPGTTGIYWNEHDFRNPLYSSDPSVATSLTLPQYFKNRGYTTKAFGKIYHQPAGEYSDPLSWTTYTTGAGTPVPSAYSTNPWHDFDFGLPGKDGDYNDGAFLFGPTGRPETETWDFRNADTAATYIAKNNTKPWFIAYGSFRPHAPLVAPDKYFDMYKTADMITPDTVANDLGDVPPIGKMVAVEWGHHIHDVVLKHGVWKDALRAYKACVSFMDNNVGIILDSLDKSPNRDNTIVIFMSDHAVHLGEKEHWWKMTLWMQTTQIPFIMRVPGVTPSGARSEAPIDMASLYPTVLDLLNLSSSGIKLDGTPITKLLENPSSDWSGAAVTTAGYKNHSVVYKNYRYIQYADGGEELYDKKLDSLEFRNLVWTTAGKTQNADIVNQMRKFLPKVNLPDVCKANPSPCP